MAAKSISLLARYGLAGTFTKAQTIRPDSAVTPLTLQGGNSLVQHQRWETQAGNLIARLSNIADSPGSGNYAGALIFGGVNATATSKSAMGIGIDTAAATPYRDLWIGKFELGETVQDVLYINHGGAGTATVDFFGNNSGNAVTINAPTLSASDPTTLALRPATSQVLPAFAVKPFGSAGAERFQIGGSDFSLTMRSAGGTTVFSVLTNGHLYAGASQTPIIVDEQLRVDTSATSTTAFRVRVTGDSNDRLRVTGDGKLQFGTGAALYTNATLYSDGNDIVKSAAKFCAAQGIGVGNSAAATTLGTVTRKAQVFNAAGASLGYVPIYDAIT